MRLLTSCQREKSHGFKSGERGGMWNTEILDYRFAAIPALDLKPVGSLSSKMVKRVRSG